MIRFSAGLVVVALGVLIGGVVTSKLSLVYVSIAVSALALVAWAIGVFLKRGELRQELFGGRPELVPAGAGAGACIAGPRTAGLGGTVACVAASPPVTPVTSAEQDRPAYGQPDGGYNAAAFSAGTQVRPTWTPKESAPKDPEPKSAPDRVTAPAGRWGNTSTPPSGTPTSRPAHLGRREGAAAACWHRHHTADAGSAGALRSWFDRPASRPSLPRLRPTRRRPADGAAPSPPTQS